MDRSTGPPSDTQQLKMTRYICATTVVNVNLVYAVCVNNNEVLVGMFSFGTEATWSMSQLNTEAKVLQRRALEKQPIPHLENIRNISKTIIDVGLTWTVCKGLCA